MSQWHSRETEELIHQLDVNPDKGLTEQEAAQRLTSTEKTLLFSKGKFVF